ncbi:MAG: hypothetical protein ACHREM_06425 [Polyangiales bacterium]
MRGAILSLASSPPQRSHSGTYVAKSRRGRPVGSTQASPGDRDCGFGGPFFAPTAAWRTLHSATMSKSWLDVIMDERIRQLAEVEPILMPPMMFGFDDIRNAITIIEDGMERTKAQLKAEHEARVAAAARNPFHDYVKEPIFASMAADHWLTGFGLPMVLRRSLLIATYSHFEHVLRQWCLWLHGRWNLPRDLASFARAQAKTNPPPSTQVVYMRYLREEAKLAVSDFEQWPEWALLDSYRLARNALAHDGGLVDKVQERSKIASLPDVMIDDSGLLYHHEAVVHVVQGACEAATSTAEAFFGRLTNIYKADPRAVPSPALEVLAERTKGDRGAS